MPIFEYACEACSHKFEKLVFSASEVISCPSCQGTQLRKLFSVFSSVSSDASPAVDMGGGCGHCGSTERRCDM